jgi:hypothetical protein
MDPFDSDEEDIVIQAAVAAAIAAAHAVNEYTQQYVDKIPYHDSAFTGFDWVLELLRGHPKRIRRELGVHKATFRSLIASLQNAGHGPSRFVTLEEQLAIFLYTCVTGLSLVHVCERFQRAEATTSKFVLFYILFIIIADCVTDIFIKCYCSFPRHHSTTTTSNSQVWMRLYHLKSKTTQSSIRFSKARLVQWTALTSIVALV